MRSILAAAAAGLLGAAVAFPAETDRTPEDLLARDILRELVEINTTDEAGDTTRAAEAMAARLRAEGFPAEDVQVLAPAARKGNLVVRLRGTGSRPPLLLLAHLDVVEARREDWSVDPFVFLEKDGYYWGRGTTDDKAMAALFMANLIRYRREGFRPERDLVLALTADEEGGDHNGVDWLLGRHRALIEAEYGLNEGGRGLMREGRRLANQVQASEKVYLSFALEVTSPGGHSSLPVRDNAIYHLAEGLTRLAGFDFPAQLSEVTRAYFERMSSVETGPVAADMKAAVATPPDHEAVARLSRSAFYNAMMRTTCVATRLDAGHADNALPQKARAVVNCRVLPGEPAESVRETLVRVIAQPRVTVTMVGQFKPSPPSPLRPDVLRAIENVTGQLWPGVPVVPIMGTGATDSLYLRGAGIPMYGVSGLFGDIDDVRAHGRDERIGIRAFQDGREFLYRLVRELSSSP
jgi:acetylornithine deacetylase/succinyl-diaminopimelate desuccinylase-like protein